MTEKDIERKLTIAVREEGGICPKFVSPGTNGMPDRLVLLPDGHMAFVELKAPGERPRKIQLRRHAKLRALGYRVYVVDGAEQIPEVIRTIREGT